MKATDLKAMGWRGGGENEYDNCLYQACDNLGIDTFDMEYVRKAPPKELFVLVSERGEKPIYMHAKHSKKHIAEAQRLWKASFTERKARDKARAQERKNKIRAEKARATNTWLAAQYAKNKKNVQIAKKARKIRKGKIRTPEPVPQRRIHKKQGKGRTRAKTTPITTTILPVRTPATKGRLSVIIDSIMAMIFGR